MLVAGLISGTSADGIDVALVEFDGVPPELQWKLIHHITVPHDPELREEIFTCFRPETSGVDRMCLLNDRIGEAFAGAVVQAATASGIALTQIDLIGSHGQTMWYEPPVDGQRGSVLTFGEPAVIAELTGIHTVSHFRESDIAANGFGAPLVSFMDWLLFRDSEKRRAIQNIGGIGNVAAISPLTGPDSEIAPLAFDTGPGNMLIDYCAGRATDGALAYDEDGKIARSGQVNPDFLFELMHHPYLHQPPPKTTGRELFGAQLGAQIWDRALELNMRVEDIVATVTAYTAETIAAAYREFLPWVPDEVYVAGGGAKNPTLVAMIQARLDSRSQVFDHSALGMPSDAKEAVLFALLAYETWHRRPGSLPVFTAARRPMILGRITYATPVDES